MSAAASSEFALTPEQLESYRRNGYLVIENWWSRDVVEKLKSTAVGLLQGFDASTVSVFSTNEQTRTSDDYFLASGDKIRFFFEEKAFNADGSLRKPVELCINKIGHNLHELSPPFREVSLCDARLPAILRALGYTHPQVVQSMYITKQPGIGGEVRPHVDGAFLYTRPQTCVGFWWPLEDCTTANGCLWAVPGSHAGGVRRRFKRNAAGTGTEFEPPEPESFDLTGAVPLQTPAGSLVMLDASVVHYSEANASERSRHAYSIHVVDGCAGVEYPADNWLQREDGGAFPALY